METTKKTDDKEEEKNRLSDAVCIVKEAIDTGRKRLEAIKEDDDPIMLVGETVTGYYAQLMVSPKTVAKIMLDYDYPLWTILDEEAPQAMWDQLAKVFGLDAVSEVDI